MNKIHWHNHSKMFHFRGWKLSFLLRMMSFFNFIFTWQNIQCCCKFQFFSSYFILAWDWKQKVSIKPRQSIDKCSRKIKQITLLKLLWKKTKKSSFSEEPTYLLSNIIKTCAFYQFSMKKSLVADSFKISTTELHKNNWIIFLMKYESFHFLFL